MRIHNGTQLYGIQKILTTLKMGMDKELIPHSPTAHQKRL